MDGGRKPSRQNPGTQVWGHHDLLRKGLVKGRGEGGAALAPPGGLQHWMCASSLQHPASLRGPPPQPQWSHWEPQLQWPRRDPTPYGIHEGSLLSMRLGYRGVRARPCCQRGSRSTGSDTLKVL